MIDFARLGTFMKMFSSARISWILGLSLVGAACGTEGAADGSGTQSSGEAGSGEEGTADEESGGGSAEGGTEGTCPPDADLERGDCPAQGESCVEADWDCSCVCGCDVGEPGEPGIWECAYTRFDALVEPEAASITVDCDGGTISGSVEFTLDNGGGMADVIATMTGHYSYTVTGGDLVDAPCGGLCGKGNPCPDLEPVEVPMGASVPFSADLVTGSCGQDETQQALCDLCGGTARIGTIWRVEGSGASTSDGFQFEDVPIECL